MKRKLKLFLALFFVGIGVVMAQTQVRGTVTDENGEPVIGASVLVKGTTVGTVTDIDGKFTLPEVPNSAKTLMISYIGMVTQEVAIAPNLQVVLKSDTRALEEVVVVGYGTQRKKDVTSSISKVSGDALANLATPGFDSQLAGRAAGVQVIQPSGVLGAPPKFRVRGINSLSGGTQPLVIVDGVPMTSGDISQGYVAANALGDINPDDIQSVDILKDGAASAIYGSRAANGVILITTKKGQKGSVKVSYSGYMGVAKASKLHDLLNGEQFTEIANEKYKNWGDEGLAVYDGTNTNWNDYVYRGAFQHSHTLSASGGTEKSQYYFSLGYTNQEGIIRANDLERLSVKGDISSKINRWLNIGMSLSASKSKINGIVEGANSLSDASFSGIRMLPNVSVFNDKDITGYNIDAQNRKALGRGANKDVISNGIPNIVYVLDHNVNRATNYRIISNAFAELSLMKGLTFKTLAGIDIALMNNYMTWDPFTGDGLAYGGLIDQIYTNYSTWNWQNILSYNTSINGLHNIDLTAVQEYTRSDTDWDESSVKKISDPFFMDHIISGTFGEKSVFGGKTFNGLASYLFRANYNYDSKYYLGFSIRRDGLSKLPKDTRWGTFWGASGAWRVSRENFWNSTVFNDFRIRGSYATVGNQNLGGPYPYLGTYSAQKYGEQNATAWLNMGNNRLKWETTETFDIGLDGSLFDSKVTFEIAYWKKNSKNLVLKVPTSPSMGIPGNSYINNVGKIQNSGIELTLGSTLIQNKDFMWKSDLNFSTLKNEVVELVENADIIGGYTIIREGESMNAIYGYQYSGVNKENGYPIYEKADGTQVQFDLLGDYTWKVYDPSNPADVSKRGSLSAKEDRKILGGTIPTWFGGWSNTFTYKNFDATMFIRFSGGNKIYNRTRQDDLLNMAFSNNGTEILGRWQSKEKPGDGVTPMVGAGDDSALNMQGSAISRFAEDGAYVKLSTLSLGYTLPKDITKKLDMSNIRIYVSGQNLLTFTKYKGLDPEIITDLSTTSEFVGAFGVDAGGKAQQRVFTFGVNISF